MYFTSPDLEAKNTQLKIRQVGDDFQLIIKQNATIVDGFSVSENVCSWHKMGSIDHFSKHFNDFIPEPF